ncbi:MAG: NFACT family protein, partial [Bacilli bacterium]|nr:NFACT family protein [Bacilli bacterium]
MKINTATLKTLIFDLKEKIIGNRITNITLINSRVFLISFSTYRKEKLLVCLDHQNPFISLCEVNDSISTITGGLSDVLRKELKEAIILDISLINEDRVVDFSLSKTNDYFEKENKHLILELIPFRSNLILLDKDGLISYAAHYSSLENNRPIIRGMSYIFIPKSDSFKKEEEIIPLEEIRLHANEYIYKAKEKRLLEKYDVLFKFIKTRIKSLKAKLTVLDNEYQNAEKKLVYQEIGSNLLAFINEKELLEQYIKDNNLDIDRNIPIGQVANLYFKKYKKAKRTLSINREEKEKAIKEIEYLEVINSQVQYMDEEDLYELAKE